MYDENHDAQVKSSRAYMARLSQIKEIAKTRKWGDVKSSNTVVVLPNVMNALLAFDRNKRHWAIVDEAPTFVNGWEDLVLKMYFPQDSKVRPVRIAAVFECFSTADHHAIISFITHKLRDSNVQLNIPAAYVRYNTLVGDGAHTRSKKQQLIKERM